MTVTLGQLEAVANGRIVAQDLEAARALPISGLELNAAEVTDSGMFAAVPGTRTHGANYASQSAGVAVLTDDEGLKILQESGQSLPILLVDDVRAVMGYLAAEIHGHPSEQLTIIGVTGTSGKTTTTFLLEGALLAAGCKTGIIGTTGTRINGRKVPSQLTTPEAPALQRLFHQMLDEGVTHVVMEVSSHALVLGRVNGVEFDAGCFLNLSQDHLDFHNTLDEYFDAKATLFKPDSPVHAKKAIVCIDDEWGLKMAAIAAEDAAAEVTVVRTPHATAVAEIDFDPAHYWRSRDVKVQDNGLQTVTVADENTAGTETTLSIPLPGAFNVANASVAWAALAAIGQATDKAAAGISAVRVPGRMERIDEGQDFLAVVDYAHKPAAVGEVLATLRAQTSGKVIAVVGAGGDRDKTKRPIMGVAAVKGADVVIITDDNPRSEDPATIRAAVVAGAQEAAAEIRQTDPNADVPIIEEIGDRAAAIARAVSFATTGDSVVVAGKGHETGQDVGGVIHPFDDREQLRLALQKL